MHTALLTDRERAAVQAYLRLLQTVQAAFDAADSPAPPPTAAPHTPLAPATGDVPRPALVPPVLLADADTALAAAGLAGNEGEFFALLRAWCPGVGIVGD